MTGVNVRSVGAKGDGFTNDTVAFRNAMDAVLSGGGGTIMIPPGRYVVGRQDFADAAGVGYAYRPQPILFAARRAENISIRGAGEGRTVLLAAPGLKIGAFDPVRGAAFDTSPWYQSGGTFTDRDYTAQPYYGMIDFEYNDGDLEVRDLTLSPRSDYYGPSAPPCGHRLTMRQPEPAASG
jgi:Pectate lyase superfamily protein